MLARDYPSEKLVLGELLREQAQLRPDHPYIRLKEATISYGELDRRCDRLAAGLAGLGVGPRQHVAVMLPNGLAFIELVFALARLGAVLVPINPSLRGGLVAQALESVDACLLVSDRERFEQLPDLEGRLSRLRSLVFCEARPPQQLWERPVQSYASLFNAEEAPPAVEVRHCDLQAIMFTSGTTGPSKGVMVTHAHALSCARTFLTVIDYRPAETVYCPVPLFHATALWEGLMAPLLAGGTTAVVERFSASRFWDDIRHFEAQIALGVFSIVTILLNQPPSPADRDHPLRAFYTGKSSHDELFRERFGARCVENYASTEAGIPVAAPYGQWRPGSCGRAWERTHEVRIVDGWDRELPDGETGEMVIRPREPFVVTTGYYNNPEATAESFRNLWFHTGDLARRDAEGNLFIVDRIKDCIRRRGENISAFEVEQVVNSHPAVLESAAIAVPSELEEDEVKIAAVLKPGTDLTHAELAAHCERNLPPFMVPRYFEFLESLPRNGVGKLAKHELRRRGSAGITPETWERVPSARPARQQPPVAPPKANELSKSA